jgi:hypothetical protein
VFSPVFWRRDSFTGRYFFTQRYFSTTRWCFFTRRGCFQHTHACALAGMFLNARALTQRYFYTEMLWDRDAFTHRNACTYTHIHTHTFTQRWLYTEQLYTQNPLQKTGVLVLFTKEWIYTKSFLYGCFCTGMLLHEFGGKGWPSASPHCHFMSIFGDRHLVRGGCVSWTSIHFALPP